MRKFDTLSSTVDFCFNHYATSCFINIIKNRIFIIIPETSWSVLYGMCTYYFRFYQHFEFLAISSTHSQLLRCLVPIIYSPKFDYGGLMQAAVSCNYTLLPSMVYIRVGWQPKQSHLYALGDWGGWGRGVYQKGKIIKHVDVLLKIGGCCMFIYTMLTNTYTTY